MLRLFACSRSPSIARCRPSIAVSKHAFLRARLAQRYTSTEAVIASTTTADAVANVSYGLRLPLEFLHDVVGIPWFWTIPLAAAAVRAILYFPITRPQRKAIQRRAAVGHLYHAQKAQWKQQAIESIREHQGPDRPKFFTAYRKIAKRWLKTNTDDFQCGSSRTTWLPMLQFPVWLSMSWTLRDMLGWPPGAKHFLYTMLGWETLQGAEAAQQAALNFEPTMMEEGLPWAADLTLADPTGTSPIMVSSIMAISILRGIRGRSGLSRYLSFAGLVYAGGIGHLLAGAPAGIMYYWACSSGFALITNIYLDRRLPVPTFTPCKRQLKKTRHRMAPKE